MTRTCIIVVDRACARFITLEIPEDPVTQGHPHLLEHRGMLNLEADAPESGLVGDGGACDPDLPAGGPSAVHERREGDARERDRRYARSVLDEAASFAESKQASRLLIVAEPRLLEALRHQLRHEHFAGVEVSDLGEDLSRLRLEQINAILKFRGATLTERTREEGASEPVRPAPARR